GLFAHYRIISPSTLPSVLTFGAQTPSLPVGINVRAFFDRVLNDLVYRFQPLFRNGVRSHFAFPLFRVPFKQTEDSLFSSAPSAAFNRFSVTKIPVLSRLLYLHVVS